RVDAFADPGSDGDGANDLADTLTGQHMRRRARALLAAGEQRPRPSCADVQPQQLRQVPPDRHLPALSPLALADGDPPLDDADILDPKLYQFGGSGAGLQQRLQHQSGAAVLGVGLVEETQFLLDSQPIDTAAMFRSCPQPGTLPGNFEDSLALRAVHALAHEDGGDSGGGTLDGGHQAVCFIVSGVQTYGFEVLIGPKQP